MREAVQDAGAEVLKPSPDVTEAEWQKFNGLIDQVRSLPLPRPATAFHTLLAASHAFSPPWRTPSPPCVGQIHAPTLQKSYLLTGWHKWCTMLAELQVRNLPPISLPFPSFHALL